MIENKSKLIFKNELANKFKLRKKEITKARWKSFFNFIDVPFSILSFFFLLPLFFMIIIILDISVKYNLLGNLINLNMDVVTFKASNGVLSTFGAIYHLIFLIFISFIPSVLYIYSKEKHTDILTSFLIGYSIFMLATPIIVVIILIVAYIILGILALILWLFGVDPNWFDSLMNLIWYLYLIIWGCGQIYVFYLLYKTYNDEINKVKIFPTIVSIGYYILFIALFLSPYINKSNYEYNEYQQQQKIIEQKRIEDARRFAIIQGTSNIRSGPSKNNKVVDRGKKVEKIEVFSKSGNWYYIEHNGKKGYIYKTLIKIVKDKYEIEL